MQQFRFYLIQLFAGMYLGLSSVSVADECRPNTFDGAFNGEVTLCQNWNWDQQQEFWFTPQGSRLIPYNWFLALQRSDSNERFASAENMGRLRYLPQMQTKLNPDGLPIGFTRDDVSEDDAYSKISPQWLGMTCAACHTGQIEFGDKKILVDGAPTMADFEGLAKELTEAMRVTLNDNDKFNTFANEVLGTPGTLAATKDELAAQLKEMLTIRDQWNERNEGDHPYGYGRLDAIGAIFNAVGATAQGQTDPDAGYRANAPVSYPFIWDTPQHDRVQWNGSVANENAGALGRNIGEVLGVFGYLKLNPINLDPRDCVLTEESGWFLKPFEWVVSLFVSAIDDNVCVGHPTSVNVANLARLETLLRTLWSPQWPVELLGPIDDRIDAASGKSRLQLGRELFEKNCLGCHDGRSSENETARPFRRDEPDRFIDAELVPVSKVKTDELMAKNFAERSYPIGKKLHRQLISFVPLRTPKEGDFFGDTGKGYEILKYSVFGTIINKLLNDPAAAIEALQVGQSSDAHAFLEVLKTDLVAAKESGSRIRGLHILLRAVIEIKRKKIAELAKTSMDDPMFDRAIKLKVILAKLRTRIKEGKAGTNSISTEDKEIRRKSLMVYKARPLNGIWATGPYLHNGSVRTLRQLLLPPDCPKRDANDDQVYEPGKCRQITFRVGSRQFDTDNIGFVDTGNFVFDTRLDGNRNTGHEFGHSELRNDKVQIDLLLEYLKTL